MGMERYSDWAPSTIGSSDKVNGKVDEFRVYGRGDDDDNDNDEKADWSSMHQAFKFSRTE